MLKTRWRRVCCNELGIKFREIHDFLTKVDVAINYDAQGAFWSIPCKIKWVSNIKFQSSVTLIEIFDTSLKKSTQWSFFKLTECAK
jgi:hypothetical protein